MEDVINVKDSPGLGCKCLTLITKRQKKSIFDAAMRDDQKEEYFVQVAEDSEYGPSLVP